MSSSAASIRLRSFGGVREVVTCDALAPPLRHYSEMSSNSMFVTVGFQFTPGVGMLVGTVLVVVLMVV